MILVTGAAGKTGTHIVTELLARGVKVRAWVRTPAHAARLGVGEVEIVVGDMMDARLWRQALVDVDAVYHIAPNMFPNEYELGKLAIAAAVDAGIRRFVFHSVLHPQTEAMPHHWQKLRVEEHLFTSGLPFTILQPAAYMQNLLAQWPAIVETGVLRQPYAPETRISLVDLADVAAAAARVLLEPGHEGAIYELTGTRALSQHEVATILSRALGRPVRAEAIPRQEWAAQVSALSAYARSTLLKMFDYYEANGFVGNPNVLRWLLGREPASLAAFARRHAPQS